MDYRLIGNLCQVFHGAADVAWMDVKIIVYIYEWRKQSRKDEMYQKLQRAIYHLCKKVKVSKRKCQYKHLVFFLQWDTFVVI